MAYTGDNENKRAYMAAQGAEIRKLRESSGYTCEYVATALNPENPSRDRISKLERGISGIDNYDLLRLFWFFRDAAGLQHPMVLQARKMLPAEVLRGA